MKKNIKFTALLLLGVALTIFAVGCARGLNSESSPQNQNSKAQCVVGGCSNQLCLPGGEVSQGFSTCEWRAEYVCYQHRICELQADGACGWTETAAAQSCQVQFESAGSIQ